MLRLEAPWDVLQITDGTEPAEEDLEVANPATWLRALVKQQKQAEKDLAQLVRLCGNTVDHIDQRIRQIEQAYQDLSEGTRYVYDRMSANEKITGDWIRSELAGAATAYQAFAQNVWEAIIERTQEATEKQAGQATQLAWINNSISFLAEANIARSQHLANFQGNVELWAEEHQKRVEYLEQQLLEARQETQRQSEALQQLAAQIRIPETPLPPASNRTTLEPAAWRSPARLFTSSLASALRQLRTAPTDDQPTRIRRLTVPTGPERRIQRPALSPSPTRVPMFGGGGEPPKSPRRPLTLPPSPTPPPERLPRSPTHPRRQATLTTEELAQTVARAVAETLSRAQLPTPGQTRAPTVTAPLLEPRINISRLKMTNPLTFDGSPTTSFNTWWRSVTKYLGFYPETRDRQKIAWVGSLLTGTAKAWDLHRYDTVGEAETWVNYSSAIRAEYMDMREAANAQIKLGQLKYAGDIRAFFTEFKALNRYARATGEGLQEKVNLAMTSKILRMRFAHYRGGFVDDEDFMEATYQAGLQVEEMKALEKARVTAQSAATTPKTHRLEERKKEDRRKEERQPNREKRDENRPQENRSGWENTGAALKGVPQNEVDDHKKIQGGCWRCGRTGHRTFECFSFQTTQGTTLPPAPWKVAALSEVQPAPESTAGPTATGAGKRKREDDLPKDSASKQQKVAAVEEMITDLPLWEDVTPQGRIREKGT